VNEPEIRARMREARERSGLSRKKLGDLLDRSDTAIQQYEVGTRGRGERASMPYALLRYWAEACGVEWRWLLHGDQEVAREEQIIELLKALNEKVDRLLRATEAQPMHEERDPAS
jgi:transcriptional regulator with XRE-family HTH domain